MRKIVFILIGIMTFSFGYSQSNTEEIDIMQAAFGMEKKAVVAEFVKLTDANREAFWTVYDEYEIKRKEIGKIRIDLLNKYAKNWETMTEEQATEFMKEVITLGKKRDALINTYYKKMAKATSAITATQFYQVESFILLTVRLEVLGNVPFVGTETK